MTFPLLQQGKVNSRYRFARLLHKLGLKGEGVEIGTWQGEFAKRLLSEWREGKHLYCVDPWKPGYDPEDPASSRDLAADMATAIQRLRPFEQRCTILRMTSAEAAPRFARNSLDFVHLDGCHQREAVANDMQLWWPKLRVGGVFVGHDIICPGTGDGLGWGKHIQPAVFEHALRYDLIVWLIAEEKNRNWSYYFIKP